MSRTLALSGQGPVTLDWAPAQESNVINWSTYGPAAGKLVQDLWSQRETIQELIRYHLKLGQLYECTVLPLKHWIQGGFNICVMVEVRTLCTSNEAFRVVFRCPMPHKLAETHYPGTVNEKMGCEVGAYAWVEEHCPEIPSPHLLWLRIQQRSTFHPLKASATAPPDCSTLLALRLQPPPTSASLPIHPELSMLQPHLGLHASRVSWT